MNQGDEFMGNSSDKVIVYITLILISLFLTSCINSTEYSMNVYSNGKDYSVYKSNISGIPIFIKINDKNGNNIEKLKDMKNDFLIKITTEHGQIIRTEKTKFGWKIIELGKKYSSKYSEYKSNILWSPVSNGEIVPKDVVEIIIGIELYDTNNSLVTKEEFIIITKDGWKFSIKENK